MHLQRQAIIEVLTDTDRVKTLGVLVGVVKSSSDHMGVPIAASLHRHANRHLLRILYPKTMPNLAPGSTGFLDSSLFARSSCPSSLPVPASGLDVLLNGTQHTIAICASRCR